MVVTRRFLGACIIGLSLLVAGASSPADADCPPGSGNTIPVLTKKELGCNKAIINASFSYLERTHLRRHKCFQQEAVGQFFFLDVDCNADVDTGTGDPSLDRVLRRAEARLTRKILTRCTNITLENLGYPGFCPDPDGAPFEAFDLNNCILAASKSLTNFIMDVEHPENPGFLDLNMRVCRDFIGRHSSRMVRAEFRDRGRCLFRQISRKIPVGVDCRAEFDPQLPGTGRRQTDNRIVEAHNFILRGVPNHCPATDLSETGFPHLCPFPDNGSIFPLPALTECLFETHHDDTFRFLDIFFPCSSQCGNGDLDITEQCDDGDIEYMEGDLCRNNCTRAACGDPNDNGIFNATDALFILRTAVGAESCDLQICDVNSDLVINATDALRHLQFDVHLPVELICPNLSVTCGNGTVDDLEDCDDGDTEFEFGESCNASCLNVACGDIDDSGRVTLIDAQYLLNAAVGNMGCRREVCDVNGNGPVNSVDALRVLRHIINHNTTPELTCPGS